MRPCPPRLPSEGIAILYTKKVPRGTILTFTERWNICYFFGMGRTRPRTRPTATELARIEKILKAQSAFGTHLGPQVPITKRTGEVAHVHAGAVAVADVMIARKLSPERARARIVLRVAAEAFGIPRG